MAIQYIQNGSLTQAQKNEIITSAVTIVSTEGYVKQSNLATINSQTLVGDKDIQISGATVYYSIKYKVNNGQIAGPNSGETWETNVTVISNTVSGNDGTIVLSGVPTKIEDGCFENDAVTEITIPNTITSLGSSAFANCPLTGITIPTSITIIGGFVFMNCQFEVVNYLGTRSQWNSINKDVIWIKQSRVNRVVCSDGIIYYSTLSYTTYNSSDMTDVDYTKFIDTNGVIMTKETDVYDRGEGLMVFKSNNGGLAKIETNAIGLNTNTTIIKLPSTLTSLEDNALNGFRLKKIYCYATNVPAVTYKTFQNVGSNGNLVYPYGSDYSLWLSDENWYLGAKGWTLSKGVDTSPWEFEASGVTAESTGYTFNYSATGKTEYTDRWVDGETETSSFVATFPQNTGSEAVTRTGTTTILNVQVSWTVVQDAPTVAIPNITYTTSNGQAVTFNEGSSFLNNSGETLTITNHIYEDGIGKIYLSDVLQRMSSAPFSGNTNLTSINFNTIKSFYGNEFSGCTSLSAVTYNGEGRIQGNSIFDGCSSLTGFTIANIRSTISGRKWVFRNCTSLTSIVLPDAETTYSNEVFAGCTALSAVTFGSGVTRTGNGMFSGCTALQNITLPETLTQIANNTFIGCALTSITFPSSLTNIGTSAFQYCTGLTSITIPVNVTNIGTTAFANCTNLTTFNYNGTMAQWGSMTLGANLNLNSAFTVVHCSDGDITL